MSPFSDRARRAARRRWGFLPSDWFATRLKQAGLFITCLLVTSSVGFYILELRPRGHDSLFDALYWSVVTLTTVGYGDIVPQTPAGRVLGLVVMVSGIGLVSTITGGLASSIIDFEDRKRKGLLAVKKTNHVVILGWNQYALRLVRTLLTAMPDTDVVLVNTLSLEERDEVRFKLSLATDLMGADLLHFISGDPSQQSVAAKANPAEAKVVYILTQQGMPTKDADQLAIYAALTLRGLAPKTPLYGEVGMRENREHLLRAGVDEIVVRGEISSHVMGLMGANPSVWPFFQSLVGLSKEANLGFRRLSDEERATTWRDCLLSLRDAGGGLPLALWREAKGLSLEDVLDEGQALDNYILELFQATGHQTTLGRQGPRVLVNPPDATPLADFDGILYLKPGAAPGRQEG